MEYRELGRTGWKVSTISFGAWAIGGTWSDVKDEESLAALHRAELACQPRGITDACSSEHEDVRNGIALATHVTCRNLCEPRCETFC